MSWFRKIVDAIRGSEDFSDIKSSTIRDILNGEILSKNFFRKQYGLIIMIAFLAFFYVDNRFECETQLAKEIELKKKIQDLKYESLTISAELMEISRQSSVLGMVKSENLQLIESDIPPVVIEEDSIQKK
ncbi:MAG: FtsL-like putative cell division protein [Paludibacter sp.]|jgi:hypothetical protein